jgi:prevent-host-death family protein
MGWTARCSLRSVMSEILIDDRPARRPHHVPHAAQVVVDGCSAFSRKASFKMLIKCYNRTMIDVTQDIHSLTTFKRNSSGLMKHMKKTGRPLVLTVKGKAEAVLLDAAAYQEVASQLDAVASIRRGLAQARKGAGRPADEVFDELEREDAIR